MTPTCRTCDYWFPDDGMQFLDTAERGQCLRMSSPEETPPAAFWCRDHTPDLETPP